MTHFSAERTGQGILDALEDGVATTLTALSEGWEAGPMPDEPTHYYLGDDVPPKGGVGPFVVVTHGEVDCQELTAAVSEARCRFAVNALYRPEKAPRDRDRLRRRWCELLAETLRAHIRAQLATQEPPFDDAVTTARVEVADDAQDDQQGVATVLVAVRGVT